MNLSVLQHSVFLNALGSAIINSVWQSCALWIAYQLIFTFYGKNKASVKNIFATFFVLLSAIFFFASFAFSLLEKQAPDVDVAATTYYATSHLLQRQDFFSFEKIKNYASGILPYLSIAYIFLFLFFMIRLVNAYKYIYTISNRLPLKAAPELHLFANKVADQMNISKKISVWISEHIDVPATIKFFKPIILIPVASVNSLSAHQLEAIILHELFHIKRQDYLINLIMSVIETILFFNPFVMLLVRIVKKERENCCDDFVLQYSYDPHAYATALLHLEKNRVHSMKLAMGAVSGKQQLLMRIKRITNNPGTSRQFNYGQKLVALIVATGIVCSFACLSPKKALPAFLEKKKVVQVKNVFQNNVAQNKREEKQSLVKEEKKQLLKDNTTPDSVIRNLQQGSFENDDTINNLSGDENPETIPFKKITLPQSIQLSGIPFLPENFKINLNDIDQESLNKDLQKAYKQINALNWKKIKHQVNESLQQANLDLEFSKTQADIGFQQAQQLLNETAHQQSYFDSLQSVQNLLQQSLNIQAFKDIRKKKLPAEKTLEKLQQNTFNDDALGYLKNKLSSVIQVSRQKNIRIIINHTANPAIKVTTDNNKLLQFSFEDKGDKNGQSLNIEFNR